MSRDGKFNNNHGGNANAGQDKMDRGTMGNNRSRDRRSKNRNKNRGSQGNTRDPKGNNDATWYASNPQLLLDAAKIPFSWANGTSIDLGNPVTDQLPSKGKFVIPGICTISTAPSVGYTNGSTSPVNVAANSIYSYIRAANSGSKNYDAPDLMIYLLTMSQCYAYINFMQRVYGCMTLFSMRNRYLPYALIEAQGVDYTNLQSQLANFRYHINMFIDKVSSFAVPSDMTFFAQQAFIYSNIYVEGESVKDQLYMYKPYGFWRYKLNTDGSGMLEFVSMSSISSKWTVQNFIDFGESLLANIISDEDFNIMNGDIIKAYGTNGIMKLATLPEYYPIVPVYNKTVLEQMKNATPVQCSGWDVDSFVKSMSITQEPKIHEFLIHQPMITVPTSADNYDSTAARFNLGTLSESKMCITDTVDPGPEVVIENTRLMVAGDDYSKGSTTVNATIKLYPGNVIPVAATIYQYDIDSTGAMLLNKENYGYADYVRLESLTQDSTALRFRRLAEEMNFKFHPAHHTLVFRNGTASPAVQAADSYISTDVDNYAVLTTQDILKLHDTAILSMLHVRSVGKIQN